MFVTVDLMQVQFIVKFGSTITTGQAVKQIFKIILPQQILTLPVALPTVSTYLVAFLPISFVMPCQNDL